MSYICSACGTSDVMNTRLVLRNSAKVNIKILKYNVFFTFVNLIALRLNEKFKKFIFSSIVIRCTFSLQASYIYGNRYRYVYSSEKAMNIKRSAPNLHKIIEENGNR